MMMEAISGNDDMLMEILKWLPLKSILRFKAVSPHWKNLLSSPPFLRLYSAAHRGSASGNLVAFFQLAGWRTDDTEKPTLARHCNVLPVRNRLENYINVPKHAGIFVNSSNGLIVCSHRFISEDAVTYYVGNPITGKFVELPQPRMGSSCLHAGRDHHTSVDERPDIYSVALICEENTNDLVPTYTLLRAGAYACPRDKYASRWIHIDSYSSKTGEWSDVSKLHVPTELPPWEVLLCRETAVVANGVVHFIVSGGIIVYDPSDGDRHLQVINMPHDDKHDCFVFTRSAHDDVLWLAVQLGKRFLFYMLPKEGGGYRRDVAIGEDEWKLMQEVSVFDISKIKKKCLVACKETTLECLFPESRSEVVAVLRQEEKLFVYNVQRKTIAKVDYCGLYNYRYELHPYFESNFQSSFCL